VDSRFQAIRNARLHAFAANGEPFSLREDELRWIADQGVGELATIEVEAPGFAPETHSVRIRDTITRVVIGLRRPGEQAYSYGDSRLTFAPEENSFLLRLRGRGAQKRFAGAMDDRKLEWRRASAQLSDEPDRVYAEIAGDMEEAARLLQDLEGHDMAAEILRIIRHSERPVLGLTNEIVVRFQDDVTRDEANALAQRFNMRITRGLRHAGNAFVLLRDGLPSYDVLDAADALARSGRAIYVEPNLAFIAETDQYAPNDPLWAQVPYLQLIKADDAWDSLDNVAVDLRGGSPSITIAVIDDIGVSPTHPELTAKLTDSTDKLVVSMNFAIPTVAPQDDASLTDDHGTQCAGTASAAFDDHRGLPGVAPNCHLLGAHIANPANAVLMADIYLYLAGFLNGSSTPGFPTAPPARAADVISSSWGTSGTALSNTVRDCFDFLTTYGRAGKGCVVCFSVGNTGYLDFTDPVSPRYRAWPTYEKTLAVGASIGAAPTSPVPVSVHPDPGGNTINVPVAAETRTLYSPYGATALRKPDLVAPSSTAIFLSGMKPMHVDPILSAVRVGTGTVNGCTAIAPCADYARTFGGTSHATPTVAGAVALMLSARPDLNWVQVREILRQSCVRIDSAQANPIGAWQDLDGDGHVDYSRWYGAGRLDAGAAVAMALDPMLKLADAYVRDNLGDVGDVPSMGAWSESPDIWVRQDATEAIPTLAWGDPPPHENALRGQDNAVFCRVRNRGKITAPVVYVRAMVTHWGGLEFAYPQDFQSSINVGASLPSPLARGTYLIGEARIDNLAVGVDQIVKMVWPQALIPPKTFAVGSTDVLWHPCLLVEASPHDGPAPIAGLAVPMQGDNNIAQRNIQIADLAAAMSEAYTGMMAGSDGEGGITSVLIDATLMQGGTGLRLHIADAKLMQQLMTETLTDAIAPGLPQPAASHAESRHSLKEPVNFRAVEHQGLAALEIRELHELVELPLRLPAGRFVPLLVAAVGGGTGDISITQRRGDGDLSPGYRIRRQRAKG
jgi:subtilisin family serine protease